MAEVFDFTTRKRNRDGWLRWITWSPHGETNADGSKREHCCGCWNVLVDPSDLFTLIAECNECGEIREARVPGIER